MEKVIAAIIFIATLGFEFALVATGHQMSGWLGVGGFVLAAAIAGWL